MVVQHGLGGNSIDEWLGNSHSEAPRLVDLGYEVWLTNVRGNMYGNHHIKDELVDGWTSLAERWDFSWAEMGLYDIPA